MESVVIAKTWTAAELGARWVFHPSHVIRVMRRFGFSGIKFGSTQQAARRYADKDVKSVEHLAALQTHTSRKIKTGTTADTSRGEP